MANKVFGRPWLKPGELSEMSGIDVQTIRKELRSGKLRGFKVGAQWLIPLDQFEDYAGVVADAQ